MSDSAGLEFTGERVIPELVDADLFNEHLARYRFAARFAADRRVLDAGCGSGYGVAEFTRAASVVGMDISAEALDHASRRYSRPGVHFIRAACESLPFADESFDLIASFEVIEHVERWREMLHETRRVLGSAGILLVSTPNKAYYAEARAAAGPNPYHIREFEYGEFESALRAVFPHVRLWTQNHSESIVFLPREPSSCGDLEAPGDSVPEHAHFFLAACSRSPIHEGRAFAWTPAAGNVLRERERHIALLETELRKTHEDQAALQAEHEDLLAELRQHNEWAAKLNAEIKAAGGTIERLQRELDATHAGYRARVLELEHETESMHAGYERQVRELERQLAAAHADYQAHGRHLEKELAATHAGYREHIVRLETEAAGRLDWVRDLEDQIGRGRAEIQRLENESAERLRWGLSIDADLRRANDNLAELEAELRLAAQSKWVRLGRFLRLAPEIAVKDGQRE